MINNNVSISANNRADNESNQWRKVKFLQILLLMDSVEEEDVLRSRERVIWTRSWIRRREERSAYHQLIRELAVKDAPAFARYFSMDKEKFNDLVGRIIYIKRQDTIMRAAISPGERLAVTLRHLATGEITKLVSPCRKRLVNACIVVIKTCFWYKCVDRSGSTVNNLRRFVCCHEKILTLTDRAIYFGFRMVHSGTMLR